MELSILCDCEIALVVLNNGTKKLVEYSSSKIDTVLSRFQRHRNLPHETHGNEDVQDKQRSTPPPSRCSSHGASGATTPWPLSPRSETAHAHIDVAFDVLLHKTVSKQQQGKVPGKPDDVGSQAVRGMPTNDSREKRQCISDVRVNVDDNVGNVPLDPRKFLDDLKKEATGQVPTAAITGVARGTSPLLSTSTTFSQSSQMHQSQRPYRVSLPSGMPVKEDPCLGGERCPASLTGWQDRAQSFQMAGEPSAGSDTMDFEEGIKREAQALPLGDVEEYVLVNTNDGIMAVPVVKPELLPFSGVDLPKMEAFQSPSQINGQGELHQNRNSRLSEAQRLMAERACQQNSLLRPPALENGKHKPPCAPASYHQGQISTSMLLPFPANEVTKCMPEPERMDPYELANLRSMLIQRALLATREDEKAKDQVLSLDEGCNVPQEIALSPKKIEREVWDAAGKEGLGCMEQGEDGSVQEPQAVVSGCPERVLGLCMESGWMHAVG
ncbi:hypothetical protein BSKO_08521 [Bryopsis sp. KO-2023]|nr:hypothetical protein BSKO_08521 [Bryopsis sp. KO-2023]